MKKVIIIAITILALAACAQKPAVSYKQQIKEFYYTEVDAVYSDTTLTEEQADAKMGEVFMATFKKHKKDSLGAYCLNRLFAYQLVSYKEAEKLFKKAAPVVQDFGSTKSCLAALNAKENLQPGLPMQDYAGENILTSEPLSINGLITTGKPLIVDFWASWCYPCRQEIRKVLLDAAAKYEGQLNILGIAVWEDQKEDTLEAMDELGICWPVIFDGGRQNSIASSFGVSAIPTMFGVTADGKITCVSHSAEEVLASLGF